jgi:hypothetical protein
MCCSFVVYKYRYSIYFGPICIYMTYCTSYNTKIDKSIASQLHSIIKKCITNNIDANTKIQRLGNAFLDAQ